VNALLTVDAENCIRMPAGHVRLALHEKGTGEAREVELSREAAQALERYMTTFNAVARGRRWQTRVHLGTPGPLWRNSGHGCWPYQDVLRNLHSICAQLGIPAFNPHALRRAFATDAAICLPRHLVAQAGGWQGLERLDNHYIQPREHVVWEKLGQMAHHATRGAPEEEVTHRETTQPL